MANITDKVKAVIKIIQSEEDIEEIDFDDKETGIHIKVKRKLSSPSTRPKGAQPD